MSRKTARNKIFKLSFSLEFFDDSEFEQTLQTFLCEQNVAEADKDFIVSETKGIFDNKSSIDKIISEHAKDWVIDRMYKVDLTIMRLAIYEMCYTDIPPSVSINEAVELAKLYGTDDSKAFVNGVLGKAAEQIAKNN